MLLPRTGLPLTVAAPLPPGADLASLRALLAGIQRDVEADHVFSPHRLPDTHFMRLVVVEDPGGDPPHPPLLVWESNHDGKPRDYLRRCAAAQRAGFDAVFGACEAYPGAADPDAFARWMRRHSIRTPAYHRAYPGVSKAEVTAARAVHDAIRDYLDAHRAALIDLPPAEIAARIRAELDRRGVDLTPMHSRLADRVDQVLGVLSLARVLPLAPAFAYAYFLLLERVQAAEEAARFDRPVHGKPAAIAQEDFITQNQLTHLVDVKGGWVRWVMLRVVLQAVGALARAKYVDGHLGGIHSIHFARWVILPDRRRDVPRCDRRDRLLFFSNYDFSWDSYLGEFIDRAAGGLTAVWSNTVGFPPAKGIKGEGARDEERFKSWTRAHQLTTDLWWSGVRDSTVANVLNDVAIRRALARPLAGEELTAWLRRL